MRRPENSVTPGTATYSPARSGPPARVSLAFPMTTSTAARHETKTHCHAFAFIMNLLDCEQFPCRGLLREASRRPSHDAVVPSLRSARQERRGLGGIRLGHGFYGKVRTADNRISLPRPSGAARPFVARSSYP